MNNTKNLIGHNTIFNELLSLYKNQNLPNKILFTGNKGIGKFLLVKKFLNFVFENKEIDKNIVRLIDENIHPNIFKIAIKNDKKKIDIDQIREMIKFQNQSSFNNKEKFIIIKDIENLNINSSNALLKSLEEPNNNLFFFLINNSGNKIPETIKSRCIEFKLSLNINEVKLIVNNFFNDEIYEKICSDYINYYNSPSFLIHLVLYLKENDKNISNFTIDNFLYDLIYNKKYINNSFIKNNLNKFIELYFYKNINKSKKISYRIKNYFYFKLSEVKKYNLDMESFFLEFEDKLLSE